VEKRADSINEEETKTYTREEGDSSGDGTLEATRTIKPSLLNWKYVAVAFAAVLAAVLVYLLVEEDVKGRMAV
jgi:hypothetical protein